MGSAHIRPRFAGTVAARVTALWREVVYRELAALDALDELNAEQRRSRHSMRIVLSILRDARRSSRG